MDVTRPTARHPRRSATRSGYDGRFGPLNEKDAAVIEFPEGLPGFEHCRRWVLIESDSLTPLRGLLALDAPEPSFLTVDPNLVAPEYPRTLTDVARCTLEVEPGHQLLWLSIVAIADQGSGAANLKAPVVINVTRMRGCQMILDAAEWPVDAPI